MDVVSCEMTRRVGGWWRLWIALSVLWGIFPTAVLINGWSEMTAPRENPLSFLDKYQTQSQGIASSDSLRTGPIRGAQPNPFDWAKPSSVQHAEEVRLRFRAIAIGLLLWLTPPMIALGLVFVGLWVYRGFQTRV